MSDRQLIADLLSALEYHTEQTRPIEFSRVAIEAAREYLRKPAQPSKPWVGLVDEEILIMSRYDLEYAALIGEVQRKLKEKNA